MEQLIIMATGDLEECRQKVGLWVKHFKPHHSQKHQVHRAVGNTDQLVSMTQSKSHDCHV